MLTVGVTSWNSTRFLPLCLESIMKTASKYLDELIVLDNGSTDDSVSIAKASGAKVIERRCSQGDALNRIIQESKSEFTLLLHSDVVLLDEDWAELVLSKFDERCALVSPEDIGCGPISRPFGKGMPESSFMMFRTKFAKKMRQLFWRRLYRLPIPYWGIDFYGDHVTHNLPKVIERNELTWVPMRVQSSPRDLEPIFVPDFKAGVWRDDLGFLRYGLGNFYRIDGKITHYHNWYDRVDLESGDKRATTLPNNQGFPVAYLRAGSFNFIRDYRNGCLRLPDELQDLNVEPRLLS